MADKRFPIIVNNRTRFLPYLSLSAPICGEMNLVAFDVKTRTKLTSVREQTIAAHFGRQVRVLVAYIKVLTHENMDPIRPPSSTISHRCGFDVGV